MPRELETWVALMRGINVGGKNILPMKQLAAMFADAGCEDVRTYIQSGNVIFRAPRKLAEALVPRIEKQVATAAGIRTPVILRSSDALAEAAHANPFLERDVSTNALHVMFLASTPSMVSVEALDPNRSPGDEFIVRGREIYMYCPNGLARSKLTNAYFDAALRTIGTTRNWRTIQKLIELTSS